MLEAIVFVGAALCVQVGNETICQNAEAGNTVTTFHRTVTDWQKIPSQTNYNDKQEVKIETNNLCIGHKCPFNRQQRNI